MPEIPGQPEEYVLAHRSGIMSIDLHLIVRMIPTNNS